MLMGLGIEYMKMSENGGERKCAGPGHLCEQRCGGDSLFGGSEHSAQEKEMELQRQVS